MLADFSVVENNRDVKFCMCISLLSGQVFSHFGELWLAGSDGSSTTLGINIGIGSRHSNSYGSSYVEIAVEHSELGVAALLKAVWWDVLCKPADALVKLEILPVTCLSKVKCMVIGHSKCYGKVSNSCSVTTIY